MFTFHNKISSCSRRLIVSHCACVESRISPSHSQSVGVLCSHCVIQHSLSSFSDDSGGVSGPRYSGSRSASGDTGEGELMTGSVEVRVHCQQHSSRYRNIS